MENELWVQAIKQYRKQVNYFEKECTYWLDKECIYWIQWLREQKAMLKLSLCDLFCILECEFSYLDEEERSEGLDASDVASDTELPFDL